jgi:hypothetical protein
LVLAACTPPPAMVVPRSTAGIAVATVALGLSNVHVLLGDHPVLVDTFYQDDLAAAHQRIHELLARHVEIFVLGHGGPSQRADVERVFGH